MSSAEAIIRGEIHAKKEIMHTHKIRRYEYLTPGLMRCRVAGRKEGQERKGTEEKREREEGRKDENKDISKEMVASRMEK